jgi:hypothetical protein
MNPTNYGADTRGPALCRAGRSCVAGRDTIRWRHLTDYVAVKQRPKISARTPCPECGPSSGRTSSGSARPGSARSLISELCRLVPETATRDTGEQPPRATFMPHGTSRGPQTTIVDEKLDRRSTSAWTRRSWSPETRIRSRGRALKFKINATLYPRQRTPDDDIQPAFMVDCFC